MPDIMGLPCHSDGTRAGHMNYGRRLDQVVGGLKARVALPDNEYTLIDEVARIHRYRGVEFGGFNPRNWRDVWLGNAGCHDQALNLECPAMLVCRLEDAVAGYPHDARVILNLKPIGCSKVAEITHHFISRGEI